MRKLILLMTLFGAAFVAPVAAYAQTDGYPPPTSTTTTTPGATTTTVPGATTTTTTPSGPTTGVVNVGVIVVGNTIHAEACGFSSGVPLTLSLNGVQIGGGTTNGGGCLEVDIQLPTGTTAAMARPMLAAIGLHLAQSDVAPEVVINGIRATARPIGEQNSLVAQGTGANGYPRTVTIVFTIAKPDTKVLGNSVTKTGGSSTGFARTGLEALRLTAIGVALIAIGWVLVQRRSRPSSR